MKMSWKKRETTILFLILVVGFLSRAYAAQYFQDQSINLDYVGFDESVYYSLASAMSENSIFKYNLIDATLYFQNYEVWYVKTPLFHHPPLFVWTLYVLMTFFGRDMLALRFLNVALGVITVYLAYLIGRKISKEVGLLSAGFLALSPLHIQLSGFLLMDQLLAALTSAFILACIRLSEKRTPLNILFCGVSLGLAFLTKYFALIALIFLLPYILKKNITPLDGARIVSVAFIIAMPWFIWNYMVYGSIISFETWRALAGNYQIELPFYSYAVFLPVLFPPALLGYASLLKSKDDPLRIGLSLVFLTFLLLFSIPKDREIRFILPALLPLTVLAADYIDSIPRPEKSIVLLAALSATLVAAVLVVQGGYFWYLPFWQFNHFFGY